MASFGPKGMTILDCWEGKYEVSLGMTSGGFSILIGISSEPTTVIAWLDEPEGGVEGCSSTNIAALVSMVNGSLLCS